MGESVESKRSNQAAPNKISQYKDTSLANWVSVAVCPSALKVLHG